eukprot:COSAG02_NODE_457_length_21950_cov_35.452794_2_plen_213_part_00
MGGGGKAGTLTFRLQTDVVARWQVNSNRNSRESARTCLARSTQAACIASRFNALWTVFVSNFCVCTRAVLTDGCPTRKKRAGTSDDYEVFCFNPNEDIGTIASSLGWDQAKQEKKWLQVYNTVVAEGQKKNAAKKGTGIVHIVYNGNPVENTDVAWRAAEQDPPGLVCPHSRSFTVDLARLHRKHCVARSEMPKPASCSALYWLDSQWKIER